MPDSDAGLTETVRLLGQVRPTFFGEYFDVRVHVDPVNLAYTAKALEMHTDVPAEELAPGVQFLHRSEEHTSELQSLMRISYAVFCLKKKKHNSQYTNTSST